MYDSDRGIEELLRRREGEQFTVDWLADQLRVYVDLHPHDENVWLSGWPPGWHETTTNERGGRTAPPRRWRSQ